MTPSAPDPDVAALRGLLTARAVRERSRELFARIEAGGSDRLAFDPARLDACADLVATVTREAYPDLAVPFHARWRHLGAGGVDRFGALADALELDGAARARAAVDLAVVSVLLDAGAGDAWAFKESRTGLRLSRSEGLAVASFDLFASGALSARPEDPARADAEALGELGDAELAAAFQASADNPLVGVEGRTELMRALGRAAAARPDLFALADDPRPGGLYDALRARADGEGRLPAETLLETLLDALGPIWPSRLTRAGLPLGDTWTHPALTRPDATDGLVPFHKLSQWLAYSLVEPLEEAGLAVTEVDALTGLAEYRNGGLFLDSGVLSLRDPGDAGRTHEPGSALIVEWRAATVALLDRLAPLVRERLGVTAAAFPLARVLEGGTWAAGRRLAAERRAGGGPPLAVRSDGTLF